MADAIRYSETLAVQVQPGFRPLIDKAAAANGYKPSEWVRAALRDALRAAGVDPATSPASDAVDSQRPAKGEVTA